MLRTALLSASQSSVLRRQIASRAFTRSLALRFIAGETLDDGLRVARELAEQGKSVTLDYLGESVTDEAEARAARKVILEMLGRIGEDSLPAGVSVKPTAMGLHVSPDLSAELLADVAAEVARVGTHLTLDMEGGEVTEATIRLVEQLHAGGHDAGCAVQSYLRRTRADVERLSGIGASLRLCKGAYAEPASVAYQSRLEVDVSWADCASYLLRHGTYPRLATHDDRLLRYARTVARREGRSRDDFEFQMLYGVRSSLQDELVAAGYRLCVYVPFGDQWYPYFMRRLAERPANVMFFLRSLRDT